MPITEDPPKDLNPTLTLIIEFFLPLFFNLIQLSCLIWRKWRLNQAGHSFHDGFPYSIKVKMSIISMWAFLVFIQFILIVVSVGRKDVKEPQNSWNYWIL
jgi:hypothetical protein